VYPLTLSIRSFASLTVFPPKETPKNTDASVVSFMLKDQNTIGREMATINEIVRRIK
jgi:hypothetical protein